MALLLSDDFARADSALTLGSASIGGAWTTGNVGDVATLPTWGISSNQAYLVANGSGTDLDAYLDAAQADGSLSVAITLPNPTDGNQAGLVFRRQDGSNRFLARLNNSTSLVQIRKILAGVQSTVVQATITPALAAGQTVMLRVELAGSSVLVFVDGVQWLSTTQTAFQTATKHGLYSVKAITPYRFDAFQFETLAPGSATASVAARGTVGATDAARGTVTATVRPLS